MRTSTAAAYLLSGQNRLLEWCVVAHRKGPGGTATMNLTLFTDIVLEYFSIHYQSRQGFNAAHRFVPFGFFQVRSWCPGLFRCSFLDHLEGANRNFRGQVTLANARQQSTEACTSFSPLDTVCRCLALLIRSRCATSSLARCRRSSSRSDQQLPTIDMRYPLGSRCFGR
ncbi:hypothetical protein L210DRAFT_344616 [Boletus edulis BED1]|uniref:Uncharacterized protein n=1 Tax=Boletus edulis BED1 TaxID=1328754 RepID=A0AAD4C357_BOLED|nr:hypothetical protein L210DRAFT_344616 [Boletus edulis BED1]